MAHILLVGQQNYFEKSLALRLGLEGYTVSLRSLEDEALALLAQGQPDVVLVCLAPTQFDALALCRHIRSVSTVPIICLGATNEEASLVRMLEAGADMYVPQPIGLLEVSARVRAGLRRPDVRALDPRDEPAQAQGSSWGADDDAARADH